MEENKNILDKTTSELTVKDQLIITAVAPLIAVASVGVAAGAFAVYDKASTKIQNVRKNRQNKRLSIVK